MIEFIIQILMMLSLGIVLYFIGRALPRINDEEIIPPVSKLKLRWFFSVLEKIDDWLLSMFEKFLRWANVKILKLGNAINRRLENFKRPGKNSTATPDLFNQDKEKQDQP